MSAMDELLAFWRARLDEAEEIARAVRPKDWEDIGWAGVGATATAHAAANDPASVLADITADRAILARYERGATGDLPEWTAGRELIVAGLAILEGVIRDRAARFSGHPEWRKEWAP